MNTVQERADFEAWADTHFYLQELGKERDGDGDYADLDVQLAFEAYQAGRAALQSQPDELAMEDIEYELRNMASSAYEIAMSFGVGRDSFERIANEVFAYARSALQSRDREDAKVARLQAVAQAVADALTMYERYGEVCPFEGEPMIHASTLVDLGELAREAIDHARRIEEKK